MLHSVLRPQLVRAERNWPSGANILNAIIISTINASIEPEKIEFKTRSGSCLNPDSYL